MVGESRMDPQVSKRCAQALQRHPLVHGCAIALLQGGVSVTELQGKAPRKQVVDGAAQCMVEGDESIAVSSESDRLTSFTWPSPFHSPLLLLLLILVAKSDLTPRLPASSPGRACDLPHLLPVAQMLSAYHWRRMTSIPCTQRITN